MAKTDITVVFTLAKLKKLFDESTCSDEKPTENEWLDFLEYFKANPEDMAKGMILDFWCQGGEQ